MSHSYRDLLKNVAIFGHGIFSTTMLDDPKERNALTVFIHRNPTLFNSFNGRRGDLVVHALSKEGLEYLEVKGKLSRAQSWQSHLDMLIINAYMAEVDSWVTYVNSPHAILEIAGKKVGLVSQRWGINAAIDQLDILLCTPQTKDQVLENIDDGLKEVKAKLCVPKAILGLRSSLN